MTVLADARGYVFLLERRQKNVEHDRRVCLCDLQEIEQQLTRCQQEYTALHRQINAAIQPGLLNRHEIYCSIRRQGVLLSEQQLIIHEINELQDKKSIQLKKLEQLHDVSLCLDKKHHNASFYLKKLRIELQRQSDRRAEDEIQEIASYGGKNIGCSDNNLVNGSFTLRRGFNT